MATSKPRFSITIDESLLKRINDHQRSNKFATQNKAILDLVQIGLTELKNDMTNEERESLNEVENTIINLLNSLNEKGQQKVIEYALDLQASGLYSKDIKEKVI